MVNYVFHDTQCPSAYGFPYPPGSCCYQYIGGAWVAQECHCASGYQPPSDKTLGSILPPGQGVYMRIECEKSKTLLQLRRVERQEVVGTRRVRSRVKRRK
jgi:hypothetical protein